MVVVLFVLLVSRPASSDAQIPIDVDFGLRGGVFTGSGVPLGVPNNQYFPDMYTTDQPQFPATIGPSFGVLFDNHWYLRFEAARSRFRFHFAQGTDGVPGDGLSASLRQTRTLGSYSFNGGRKRRRPEGGFSTRWGSWTRSGSNPAARLQTFSAAATPDSAGIRT